MPLSLAPPRRTFSQTLLAYWERNPLASLLIIAAIPRLVAVLFSKGYAMSDDHFLIIERAQQLADGLPNWYNRSEPFLHSLIYPGLHYYFFAMLDGAGFTDPQGKMYLVRLIHAAYSLLIVYYGYLITKWVSGESRARWVGLTLALFWCLPFLSVRNLREIVCIPPLMAAFYYYMQIEGEEKKRLRRLLLIGFLFSVAFILRFQALLFPIGLGGYLVVRGRFQHLLFLSCGFALGAAIEGFVEWRVWGYPFITLYHYIYYNFIHASDFPTGPWYQFVLTILGIFLPPFSLALTYGFLRNGPRYAPIFWGTVAFFIFHSFSLNKQERFIFPMIPFFFILGLTGWLDFIDKSAYWQRHRGWLRGLMIYVVVLNGLALAVVSITYSKRSRAEAMYYLSQQPDFRNLIVERDKADIPLLPRYYLGHWVAPLELTTLNTPEAVKAQVAEGGLSVPNYVVFFGSKNLAQRVARVKRAYPLLQPEAVINISLVDYIAYVLNPRNNENETAYIYKIPE